MFLDEIFQCECDHWQSQRWGPLLEYGLNCGGTYLLVWGEGLEKVRYIDGSLNRSHLTKITWMELGFVIIYSSETPQVDFWGDHLLRSTPAMLPKGKQIRATSTGQLTCRLLLSPLGAFAIQLYLVRARAVRERSSLKLFSGKLAKDPRSTDLSLPRAKRRDNKTRASTRH